MSNRAIVVAGAGGMILGIAVFLYFRSESAPPQLLPVTSPGLEGTSTSSPVIVQERCLEEGEYADYPLNERYDPAIKVPRLPLEISVRDWGTKETKFIFRVDDVDPKHYHPLEMHRCGVYVVRKFNYDPNKSTQEPGFRSDLSKYDYGGKEKKIMLLAEKKADGSFVAPFSFDFRIDPHERYLVLEQSYLGQDDYALVIKNLQTLENVHVLRLKDVLAARPDVVPGSFGLGTWKNEGRYLWGDIFQGALSTAYYRIEAETWKTDILPTPPDMLAGVERAVNFENGYLAYVDIPTFTGFQEVYEQIIEDAKREGREKNLYLYNLWTRENKLIASTDPDKRFNLTWRSDAELEYTLPDGRVMVERVR